MCLLFQFGSDGKQFIFGKFLTLVIHRARSCFALKMKERGTGTSESRHREAPITQTHQAAPIGARPGTMDDWKIRGFRFIMPTHKFKRSY